MKLIVGLGNPGFRYVKTRHNVGRRVVEKLGASAGGHWKQEKILKARWMEAGGEENIFRLALPDCFMNESGETVARLLTCFGIDFKSDFLVVADDAALPLGRLRLRASGQDGGHRGLRSIEQALSSKNYARLRIGIAPSAPVETPLEEYVLSPFQPGEEKKLEEVFERALKTCHLWISGSIEKAMNWANQPSAV